MKCECGHKTRSHGETGCAELVPMGEHLFICGCEITIRDHAAALLHKARAQRDAEAERVQTWIHAATVANERRHETETQLAEADAATQAALEVAEREHARAEELRNELREVYEILDNVMRYAPTPAYHMTLYSVWHGKARKMLAARRLLAANKEQERAV